MTHALLIQPSKMAAGGHFVKTKEKKLRIDMKWPEMRSKVISDIQKFKKIFKIRMDLKWPEMPSKVNFGYPK